MNTGKRTNRIIFSILAVVIGILIVFLLSIAGEGSRGPMQSLLDNVAKSVQALEERMILQRRESKRSRKLTWFEPYVENIDLLKDPEVILLGASDTYEKESFESIIDLEDSLNTTFPLIHIYNAWGSKEEQEFPELEVLTILELGSLPVITWEPWLTSFDPEEYPGIPPIEDRGRGCLRAIAEGTYDKYIIEWAGKVRETGSPIFVRLGHEMNDPYRYPWGPQNNKPKDFIDAWIHVHEIFQAENATNVLWVWSPHPSYGYFDAYYPGKDYVDYIGSGILNFGNVASWSKWWTFDEIFGKAYPALDTFEKPMMITEFGSLNVGGDRSEWFKESFKNLPELYPSIKSLVFFHYSEDRTVTNKVVSWEIIHDPASIQAIKEQIMTWPDSIRPPDR